MVLVKLVESVAASKRVGSAVLQPAVRSVKASSNKAQPKGPLAPGRDDSPSPRGKNGPFVRPPLAPAAGRQQDMLGLLGVAGATRTPVLRSSAARRGLASVANGRGRGTRISQTGSFA